MRAAKLDGACDTRPLWVRLRYGWWRHRKAADWLICNACASRSIAHHQSCWDPRVLALLYTLSAPTVTAPAISAPFAAASISTTVATTSISSALASSQSASFSPALA